MKAADKKVFLKLVEELSELSVELLQQVNKPNKGRVKKILDEIEDVELRLKPVKRLLTA